MCLMFGNICSTIGTMVRADTIYARSLYCWRMWWILSSYFMHFPSIVFSHILFFKKKIRRHTRLYSHLPGKPVNQWKCFWLPDKRSEKNVVFMKVSRSNDWFNLMQNFMINFLTNYGKNICVKFSGDFSHVTRPMDAKSFVPLTLTQAAFQQQIQFSVRQQHKTRKFYSQETKWRFWN